MRRILIPVLGVAAAIWLAPGAQAQGNHVNSPAYRPAAQNGATATGDPWMNENDYDYNRRHWLPGPGDSGRDHYGKKGEDRYERSYRPDNRYRYDDED
jgi:hypothetical protein